MIDNNCFAPNGFSRHTPTITQLSKFKLSCSKSKRTLGRVEIECDINECFNNGSCSVCIRPETKRIVWSRDGRRIMRKMFRRMCKLYKTNSLCT